MGPAHFGIGFAAKPAAPKVPLLFRDSPKVELGLWASGPGFIISIILELALLAGGIAIYMAARKRKLVPERRK